MVCGGESGNLVVVVVVIVVIVVEIDILLMKMDNLVNNIHQDAP